MPYRRLPNTDRARFRAIKVAITKGKEIPPFKLAFSQSTLQHAKQFFPAFEQAIIMQKEAQKTQVQRNKDYVNLQKKARLYISHFMQVLNFAILRGEMPASVRKFYGLNENDSKIPALISEQDILEWGEKIITGDSLRVSKGGNYITNPTIAVVKVRYEQFKDAHWKQKGLQEINNSAINKVAILRPEADKIIRNVWNEVEAHFENIQDDEERREACQEYGISYVYRPKERERAAKLKAEQTAAQNNDLANERKSKFLQYTEENKVRNTEAEQIYIEQKELVGVERY